MPFSLEQFGEVLRARNPARKPYVVIGGQAVNYWATRYLPQEAELSAWQPFTSKDIDFRGNRDDVLRMAAQLQQPAIFPHAKMMTAFAGAIVWPIGEHRSRVEFVRQVPGATAKEVEKLAVEHDYLGQRIRIIDPVSLLACKLILALTVDQTNRRDADHARILLLCTRAFLRETLRGVEAGELPARGWLGVTERLLKVAEAKIGGRATRELKIQWPQALPEPEIAASKNPLLVRFREKRLAQWRGKIQQPRRRK
jgi:hypothetical protein